MFFSLFLLVVVFLIEGIYGLVVNSQGTSCIAVSFSNEECIKNTVSMTSIANKQNDPVSYYIKSWLNFVTILIIFIFLQYFRRHQRLTDREIDRGLTSASDYTIMITKLPIGEYDESIIKYLLTNIWEQENSSEIKIVKTILAYNVSEYVAVLKKKEALNLKKIKAEAYFRRKGRYPNQINPIKIEEELIDLQRRRILLEKDLSKGIRENACGIAFVSFASQTGWNCFFIFCYNLFLFFT